MALKNSNINLENIPEEVKTCPEPTKTAGLNTANGDRAIQELNYGPAEGESACGNCALFDISSRMKKCTGGSKKIGYCWKNHFECESKNTCDVYVEGGPIINDEESFEMQNIHLENALSKEPYEPEEQPVEEQSPEIAQPVMQQQPVEMMQSQMNEQMSPQGMMPPEGMMPPMQQPMMAYGGDLPKAQMGDWFSNKLSQAKNFAADKYKQAQDYKTQLTDAYKETEFYTKGQDLLDKGQDVLSVAGMIPGIGAIPDAVNAAISGARVSGSQAVGDTDATNKNLEDLAWNSAAIIPGAGQAATTAKFAKRAIQNTVPSMIKNTAKVHNTIDTGSSIIDGGAGELVDSPVNTEETEQPLVTRDGYELPRALYGTGSSPTKGSPYAGSPLANLLTFPHWSATMNLGSGSGSKEEYKPVEKIGNKNVFYNEETGEYESEVDHYNKTGEEYYQKLHEDNPDHFGKVKAYDSNSESIIYKNDEEADKVGSQAFKNNPEAEFINYSISDDGSFTFNAVHKNDDGSYEFRTPNTWTAQYASTVDKLKQFIPDYNPDDYRFVSKSGEYAYPNQGDQFETYWNNYYMNNPYRAYEQMAEGGELPLAKNGYHMSYHNRGKTHGTRSQYGYYPYSIPAGGDWETVQHGTNQPKWEETEGWKEDSKGNQTWNISQNDAQKWLRGRGHLTKDLTDQQKSTWAFNMYHGSPVNFKKWKHPHTKKDMVIVEMGRDKIYVPADSALGQFNADQFNEYKKQSEGSYSYYSTPFTDHKRREGPRTDEEKQLEYDWRNTPYQQEYRIGKDGYTWGGWKYNGADRDMTYKFRDTDLSTLPYKLQQKYRIDNRSRLTKDAKTGKIYVYNEGKMSPTIQHDDLKWFNNPGRLGDAQTDPSFGKGDNIFDYLNNTDWQPTQRYPDLDDEKMIKKDHKKFMWDVKQEAKKIEEEEKEKSKEYFKKNPWRIKEIEEDPEEEEIISIYDPNKDKETPVIPSMQDIVIDGNAVNNGIKGEEDEHFDFNNPQRNIVNQVNQDRQNIWTPIEDVMGASTGSKNVSSKITNSAANAITQAYQTGMLGEEKYGEADLQRDLSMYGDAYGSENLEKLKNHLQLPTSRYGSELSRYAQMGTEYIDQAEMSQNTPILHHVESIAAKGTELPKAQVNIRNEADYSRFWNPDWKDDLTFNQQPTDYNMSLGINQGTSQNSNFDLSTYQPDTTQIMQNIRTDQYYEENPELEGVPTMQDLQEGVDAGNQVQEELDASGTPTPNPQAQFTEFMDEAEGMTDKNDYSQLTDEERKQLEQHKKENEEEDDEGGGNPFAAVASDIVGLAQGVINPMLEARDARKQQMKKYQKSSDDIYSASATTQGTDPFQGGMDTIYQDTDYGTNPAKRGKETEDGIIEIDMETYRKLIAAGADIEII